MLRNGGGGLGGSCRRGRHRRIMEWRRPKALGELRSEAHWPERQSSKMTTKCFNIRARLSIHNETLKKLGSTWRSAPPLYLTPECHLEPFQAYKPLPVACKYFYSVATAGLLAFPALHFYLDCTPCTQAHTRDTGQRETTTERARETNLIMPLFALSISNRNTTAPIRKRRSGANVTRVDATTRGHALHGSRRCAGLVPNPRRVGARARREGFPPILPLVPACAPDLPGRSSHSSRARKGKGKEAPAPRCK